MKSIEDELEEQRAKESLDKLVTPESLSSKPFSTAPQSLVSSLLPRRLSDLDWVRRRGWVENGTGNVLVWGAPDVDNVGRVSGVGRGPKLV